MAPKIMNPVVSILIFILFTIQSVSHSQYYPQSDEFSSYEAQPLFSTTRRTAAANNNHQPDIFNARNLNPPYRQHQHQPDQHSLNVPYGVGTTTVRYYGTKRGDVTEGLFPNFGVIPNERYQSAPSQFSASYRKLPGLSRNPQFFPKDFDFGGFGVSFDDGGVDISFRDPSNEGSDIFRINQQKDRHPQKTTNEMPQGNGMRRKNDEPNESSIERPLDTLPECGLNQRIFREDGQCYNIGNNSICGNNMRFYEDGETYGDCDCDSNNGFVSRPLVYWKPSDNCYLLYHRGPCGYSEWLILDRNNRPRCAPRLCPRTELESEQSQEFWFLHEGKCFKTGQHYSYFCAGTGGEGNEIWKVWFNSTTNKPECLKFMPRPFVKSLLSPVSDLRCRPGYKKMQNGECKRTTRFETLNDY